MSDKRPRLKKGPVGPDGLTDRQRLVLGAILAHWRENGVPPSVRDLARKIGLETTSGVTGHLRALARKQRIDPTSATTVGIYPVGLRDKIKALIDPPPEDAG